MMWTSTTSRIKDNMRMMAIASTGRITCVLTSAATARSILMASEMKYVYEREHSDMHWSGEMEWTHDRDTAIRWSGEVQQTRTPSWLDVREGGEACEKIQMDVREGTHGCSEGVWALRGVGAERVVDPGVWSHKQSVREDLDITSNPSKSV